MKYILLIILFFYFLTTQGQNTDSLVCIKPSTARYYLERNDMVEVLQKKDSVSDVLINSLDTKVILLDSVIVTYAQDKVNYDTQLKLNADYTRLILKREKRLKKTLNFTRIGIGVLLILLIVK